jgi:TP901 family phage tail tape measure protein
LPTAAELNVKINSTLDERGFDRAEERTNGLGKRLSTVIGTAGGFLLAGAVNQVVGSIGGLVTAGLDFEAQMANVNSIAQLSGTELQNLSDQVLALAQNPGITAAPAELAAGLYQVSSSGFVGAEGIAVLEASALAASAGLTTTETAATAITAALNAYGLEASSAGDISDMMFQTVNDGVISFEQLASNMGNVLPVASSLGVGFDEVGAAYAQMTLAGVNASAAETQIAAVMRSALNPTQQLTDAVTDAGFASATAAIESEGLAGFLKIVGEASGGSEEELFNMLGTTEAMNAALLLGGDNLDAYIEEIERMGGATEGVGATQKALNKQMQSASFQIAKAKQQVQVAATMFMGLLAPGIAAAAQALTGFISKGIIPFGRVIGEALRGGDAFRDLVDELPQPLRRTVGALGSVFEAVGDVARAFGEDGLSGAIRTLTTGGELDQIGTAFSAIADEAWNGIVAGFNAINWGAVWDIATAAISLAAGTAVDITDWAINVAAPKVISWLGEGLSGIWDWLQGQMGLGSGTVGDGTGGPESDRNVDLTDWVLDVAAPTVIGWIKDVAADIGPHLKTAAGWAAKQIVAFGDWELNTVVPNIIGWVKDNQGNMGDALKRAAGWVSDNIIVPLGDWTINTIVPDLLGWLNDNKGDLWEGLKTIAGIPGQIQGAVTDWVLTVAAPSIGGWLLDIGGNIWGWLKEKMGLGGGSATGGSHGGGGGGETASGAGDSLGISSMISGAISGGLQAASDAVVGLLNDFGTDAEGWKDDLIDAVKGIVPDSLPNLTMPTFTIDMTGVMGVVMTVVTTLDGWIKTLTDKWNEFKSLVTRVENEGGGGLSAAQMQQNQGLMFGAGVAPDPNDQGRPGTIVAPQGRAAPGRSVQQAPAPIIIPAPDTSAFDRAINELPQQVARALASAVPIASAGGAMIGSSLSTSLSAGLLTAIQTFNIFRDTVTVVLSTAAANAIAGGVAIGQGLATGVQGGVLAAIQTLNIFAAYVPAALAGAAGAAYSAGVNIGQSLASGIRSQVGEVAAAAAALAAAATSSTKNSLGIASPSKVFTEIGNNVGDGLVQGIQSRYGAAGRAGQGLADSSIPTTSASLRGRSGGSGQTIIINALKSDELVRLIEKAERGSDFARDFPQLVRQGAY